MKHIKLYENFFKTPSSHLLEGKDENILISSGWLVRESGKIAKEIAKKLNIPFESVIQKNVKNKEGVNLYVSKKIIDTDKKQKIVDKLKDKYNKNTP